MMLIMRGRCAGTLKLFPPSLPHSNVTNHPINGTWQPLSAVCHLFCTPSRRTPLEEKSTKQNTASLNACPWQENFICMLES